VAHLPLLSDRCGTLLICHGPIRQMEHAHVPDGDVLPGSSLSSVSLLLSVLSYAFLRPHVVIVGPRTVYSTIKDIKSVMTSFGMTMFQ
jgi:hypothetical protein